MSVQVVIDGTDVTSLSLRGSSTRRLNRMSQAQVTLPMESAVVGFNGARMKIYFDGNLHHHGIIELMETEAGEDTGTTTFNSRDPLDIWQWRPVRDADGDYTKPQILQTYGPSGAPVVIYNMATNSENAFTGAAGDPTPDGALLLDFDAGDFAAGGTDVSGAPTDWPMTMSDFTSMLTSTGRLDIVVTPIEEDMNGNIGQLSGYNGDYGTDLSATVVFSYGMGDRNIRNLRYNQDATNVISKLRYLLGPRVLTSSDPAGDQHWKTSVGPGTTWPDRCNVEASRWPTIEANYGGRFDIKIFDGDDISSALELYQELFGLEACLRSNLNGRTLVHITPTRESEIGTFDIGDIITVEADTVVAGGFSGEQRVYGYTIAWGDDSVRYLDEIVTSPDQEGLTS